MDNIFTNKDKESFTHAQYSYRRNDSEHSDNTIDIRKVEISYEQKVEQESFLKQFTEFLPSKKLTFLKQDYEFRLIQNISLNSNLYEDIYLFYKDQHQYSEKIKNKILARLSNNLHYSMNHLSLISKFLKSYSSFKNFCDSAQMILSNKNCQNPPYTIFEHAILNNILNTHRRLFLKNLLIKFKNFSLIRRREILNITVNRFFTDIKKSNSIPIASNSKERIISELTRLSQHLGINFDQDSHDGQHFIYECETLLSDFQRLRFSFSLVKDFENKPSKLIDNINHSFMETFSKEELIVEAFENIIHPNERYKAVVFNTINNKAFPIEQIQALISLRFCRNRQLLLEIESFTKKLCKYRNLIYENFNIKTTEPDESFCNKYISYISEQVLVFTSAIYVKSDKKGDLDPLIENSLEKQLRYLKSKIEILIIFYEISKHSDSNKIKEYTDKIIEKKPNLIFRGSSFYELFEVQIDTLEMIGKTLSIILNLQILHERQITSFYGSFYEPFQFGTFYSNQGEGEFNTSNFEVYPNVDKILQFFTIALKTVEAICSTISIKSIEYSEYLELAVWIQLMNEVSQNPEMSLFGIDYSTIKFNSKLSKNVESLMNCRILDDPNFLKGFISKIEDKTIKSKFTQNLANFCLLATKLRTLVYKTNLYLPLYTRQYNEANFSVDLTKTIEFIEKTFDFSDYSQIFERCNRGDFSDIIDIINRQRRYNFILRIAIQFNNYRSDNYCISFLFNLPTKENLFFITKSETQMSEKARFFRDASKEFFVDIDSFINQDFSTVFFNVSEFSDFSNPQKLIEKVRIFLNRIELASLTNFERLILNDFQQFDFFSLDGQFYRPSEKFVDYFVVPNCSQCLSADFDSELFDHVLNLVSYRLKLISFVRLNSFLKVKNSRAFDLLYRHKIGWESIFFSKLHSTPIKSIEEALATFKAEINYELCQFEVSILLLAQKVFFTKRACHLKGRAKPTNLNLIPDDEIRLFWKNIHFEYLDQFNCNQIGSVTIDRYIPAYLSSFNFSISDKMKIELIDQITDVRVKVDRNVVFSENQNLSAEPAYRFVKNQLVNELLKFVLLRLQTNVLFKDLNIVSIIDITRREYKDNMQFYSKNIAIPSTQKLPDDFSNGIDNSALTISIHNTLIEISQIIEDSQRKENYLKSQKMAEQLEVFNTLDSPMKPECYIKRKNLIVQNKGPYNPNPIDAQRQFDQEMRYVRSKIVFMIVKAMNNNNNDQQMLFNLNQDNQKIMVNFDYKSLISRLIPLSSLLSNLIEMSRIQILKTWPSYTENMKGATIKCDEQTILLNEAVKSIKEHYNMELNYRLSIKASSNYLKLSSLRNQEKTINHEQNAYDEEITKEIRNEYEQELREIKNEQQEILKQFPIVHNRYFKEFEKVIQKQNEKVPLNEEILKPNHEIAQRSLQISEESHKEIAEIKHDEEIQKQIMMKEEEERKKQEREFEEQAERKRRQLPTFDITSPRNIRPINTSSNPIQFKTSKDDSSVAFQPQSPRLKLNSQRQFKRRHTMVKSKTQDSLLEASKSKENSEIHIPTFIPRRHINSVTSQRSKELLNIINQSKSSDPDVQNQYETNKKFKIVEADISELKNMIIKLRITKCLSKIGTTIHFKKSIEKVSHERKEASMLLWFNRKSYEEDTRDIKDDIADCFKRLSECEKESDNLKQELEAQRAITTKLAHWKELNLTSTDRILKQIGAYEKGPNIEVSKLLKKLEEKREELEALNKEAEEFEFKLIEKVRQPMEEMSRIRKAAQKQEYQNLKMKENLYSENSLIASRIQSLNEENKKILDSNEKLKTQIKKLENQKAQVPSIKIEATRELFELKFPTTRRLKTSYVSQKRGKTILTAKSPYYKIGRKSIKRPL